MQINKYILGPFSTNTYLLEIDNKCLLIDPASKAEKLITLLEDKELLAILLTHGHFDHLKAVDGLYHEYHMPTYIHQADEKIARDKNAGSLFNISSHITTPTMHIEEGIKEIGPFKFEVIYTPGHTKGSLIYIFDNHLFSGDTLFKGSIGRTDLEGGSIKEIKESLNLIKNLNIDYIIHPGHDEETTLFYEINNNPFLIN